MAAFRHFDISENRNRRQTDLRWLCDTMLHYFTMETGQLRNQSLAKCSTALSRSGSVVTPGP